MFIERLRSAWRASNSLICVGLDPDRKLMPASVAGARDAIFQFNRAIIDATGDLVCAFKPQIAYYAAERAEDQLEKTIAYIREKHPRVLVILDAKRGDIGSTAELYAREAFDRYDADAVTVNPYLGGDALEPFLSRGDKGVIVLCRTSNPGAADFQETIYRKVAERASKDWNRNGNVLLVMGATYPEEMAEIRALVGDLPFLVPGVGAQGGSVEAVVTRGQDSQGAGLIINSSRAILYASRGTDFGQAARRAALSLRDEANRFRTRSRSSSPD